MYKFKNVEYQIKADDYDNFKKDISTKFDILEMDYNNFVEYAQKKFDTNYELLSEEIDVKIEKCKEHSVDTCAKLRNETNE